MLVQALKNLYPLALLDPEIPGAIELPDGKGINLAAARLNFPDKGLKVRIPIWANKSLGDKVELLLNNNMVDQQTITDPVELTERSTLFIAPNRLLTGPWELAYRVKRLSQQWELFAPPLKLHVKLEVPGGQDIDPDYGHSELYMTFFPPKIVQDGVDKDSAKDGVDIIVQAKPGSNSSQPYPNIAVDDVITVSWGGKRVQSDPVSQAQIDTPSANPIKIHVDEATILAASDSGPEGLAVTFMIRDRVLNQSEDWCKETRIVVDTGNSRLDAPILDQADGDVLDLDKLNDEQLLLQVWAASAEFQQNDVIIMNLRGTTLDGETIDVKVRQSVEKKPPTVVEVLLSNTGARALAKSQAVFSYELERAGTVIQRSKGRFITIVGEPTRLAAPIALDDLQGAIDPDLPSTRIRIPYDPLITSDNAIELKWFGSRPDSTTYDPELKWFPPSEEEADDPEGFIVTVEGSHLKTLEGGTLDLSYNLLSDEDGTIVRRPSLHAARLNIGEPQFELVKPVVLGEKDGALEPKDLPNGIGKLTAPRPVANPSKSGDIVTYTWVGEASGTKEDFKKLNELSRDKDVDFTLNTAFVAEHIEPNRGKKVTVSYRIWRAETNTTSYSNVLEFVVGEAVALDPPTIESVKGLPSGDEIAHQTSTRERTFEFSGKAAANRRIELKDTGAFKHTITVTPTGGWTQTLNDQPLGPHRYTLKALYGNEPESDEWAITVTPETGTTLEFVNAPYVVAPDALLTYIELKAVDVNGEFVKETPIHVTIPENFSYADGSTGRREFKTDLFGQVVIKHVKGPDAPATSYTLKAELEGKEITAKLDVTARGKIGELDISFVSNPIAVSPDGTKICASEPGAGTKFIVIDAQTLQVKGSHVKQLYGDHLAIGPDSNQVFITSVSGPTEALIINLATEEKTVIRLENTNRGQCVWNLDGTKVYFMKNPGLEKFDILLNREERVHPGAHYSDSILLSPDGRRIFTISSWASRTRSYDAVSDTLIKEGSTSDEIKSAVISPDGKHIYCSNALRQKIKALETTNLSETRSIDSFKPGPIVISPDGQLLYVGSGDAKVRILKTENFQLITTFDVADNPRSLAISPDGSRLYIAYENKTVITAIQIE
ncbi:WD40 repeat domain-containing protein [Pseudomonas sp. LB3P25]